METTVIKIAGMSCGACVQSVEKALRAVPGVVDVQVSLDEAKAVVQHDPIEATQRDLRQAIEAAGYGVAA